jgi:hypothetical protein
MKHFTFLTSLLLPLCSAGCLGVPQTVIRGNLSTGEFAIHAPKDGDLRGLEITRETNGVVHIKIQSHTVRMNPDVITQSGDRDAKLIHAALEGAGALVGEAAKHLK